MHGHGHTDGHSQPGSRPLRRATLRQHEEAYLWLVADRLRRVRRHNAPRPASMGTWQGPPADDTDAPGAGLTDGRGRPRYYNDLDDRIAAMLRETPDLAPGALVRYVLTRILPTLPDTLAVEQLPVTEHTLALLRAGDVATRRDVEQRFVARIRQAKRAADRTAARVAATSRRPDAR
jgi:hypothetical protein